jgi:tRNA-specific 2-thiouridylase
MSGVPDSKLDPNKVVVALSGGVDSSLCAALLQDRGWHVRGLHLLLPSSASRRTQGVKAVQKVADHLRIRLDLMNLEEAFTARVVHPFVDLYLQGLTPNPCVLCNRVIKFDRLIQYADSRGIGAVATGHYARVRRQGALLELWRGADHGKEQSYFLHRLSQRELQRTVFPLGDLTKGDVRRMARSMGLSTSLESESQEICFLSGRDYRFLLEEMKGEGIARKGEILTKEGRHVGEHYGTYRYTIGQRHGLGIASSRPYYVMEIRAEENQVVVGRKEDLFSTHVEAEGVNWVSGKLPCQGEVLLGQIRYRHKPARGRLQILSAEMVTFEFEEPQWAVTPGQALVIYKGERVLGGGWITKGSRHKVQGAG